MFAFILLFNCLLSQTVPLPPERDTPVCDDPDGASLVIQLMFDEASVTGNPEHCTHFGTAFNANAEIPWDIQCACYNALPDSSFGWVYEKECLVSEYSSFWMSEAAMYCRQDINLIGATEPRYVEKSTDSFDLSTWEGLSGSSIAQGQMIRKTFSVNDMDTNSVYGVVKFKSIPTGTWDSDDKIVVRFMRDINGVEQWREEDKYRSSLTPDTTEDHMAIFALYYDGSSRRRLAEYTFTVGFTLEVAGSDQSYWIEMVELGVYSRDETALICRGSTENIGSSFYPIFNQQESGFMAPNTGNTADSELLTFVLEMPRYYYDISIDFSDGNGFAGYSESRTYSEDVDSIEKTYWQFSGLTVDDDPCGYEKVSAQIPWTVMNEAGGGNLAQLTEWNDGTGTIDDDDAWYKFGGTIELTANEHVYTENTDEASGLYRNWRTAREQVWRVPFVIRQQRIVLVVTTFDVNPPALLIDFVGALTKYVQAETVYDLSTRDNRAFVTMDITTKTRYPYMLIPGYNDDDPPVYFEDMDPPLDTDSWYPPHVSFNTTNYPGIAVQTNFTWVWEDREACSFISSMDISINDERVCEQDWRLDVIPLNGACYIDGLYTIEFGARCFYDKPTCLFNTDPVTGEVANTVIMVLDVESTNMCPELVMDVDIYGEMCDTGRLGWMRCADYVQQYPCGNDASACVGPPPPINAYFQNDPAYFFVEVFSNDAKIIHSQITDIWTTPINEANLFSVQLYKEHVPLDLSYSNPNTGMEEVVPAVILDVQDSDYFSQFYENQGTGSIDYGNFAGFRILLDDRVFPAPIDFSDDWTFTVRVEVLYEGWGNEKRRRLVDVNLPLKGADRLMIQESIAIGKHPVTITDCPVQKDMRWVFTLGEQYDHTSMVKAISSIIESSDFSLHDLSSEDISHTWIVDVRDKKLWTNMQRHVREQTDELKNSPLEALQILTCMDIPGNNEPSQTEVLDCGLYNQACSFYDGQTLEEYLTGFDREQGIIDVSESGVSEHVITLLCLCFMILFM